MKVGFLVTALLISCPSLLWAQSTGISYKAQDEILWAGVDRASDLIILLKSGVIEKINLNGKRVGQYSFDKAPTLIDPLDGAQAFYYFRASNDYGTISSDFSFTNPSKLEPSLAVTPWLVAPMLHELFIVDVGDFTLKKTSSGGTALAWETTMPQTVSRRPEDLTYMKEYQNYVFILDRSAGIHVFNSLGKFLKTIGEKNIDSFGFIGEEIYYSKETRLILTDLYSGEMRELSLPGRGQFYFVVDEFLYEAEGKVVQVLPFKP